MLDVRVVRENQKMVEDNLKKRQNGEYLKLFKEFVEKDKSWRIERQKANDLRAKRNELTGKVMNAKKEKKPFKKFIAEAKKLPEKIKKAEAKAKKLEEKNNELLLRIPNLLHDSVPFGKSEADNVEIKTWGKTEHNPSLIHHGKLAVSLGLADFERAVKISGEGFYFLKGDLAKLEFALHKLALDMLEKKGFTFLLTPMILNKEPYEGATDLKDFETMMYKIEGQDSFLIATSEHPMSAMYRNEILEEEMLPIKYAGYSACFRKEIGKHGLDERGLFRVHQFTKVEQFVFCKPEDSWKEFEKLSRNQQEFFEALEIPYRVVDICTGEIGILASKKFDLEAWSPREGKYIEAGSCSNCTSYQAVRQNTKYRKKNGEKEFLHTLNNTMITNVRPLRLILENFQTPEGTVKIPKSLQQYMGKKEIVKQ